MSRTPLARLLASLILAALLAACSQPAATTTATPTPPMSAAPAPAPSVPAPSAVTIAPTTAPAPTGAPLEPTSAPAADGPSTGDDPGPPPQWLVYRRGDGLYAARRASGLPQLLASIDADEGEIPWAAAPDGSALAFVRTSGLGGAAEFSAPSIALYAIGAGIPGERKLLDLLPPQGVDLTPGEEASMGLLPALTSSQRLAWAPDGSGVVVASAHEGGQVDLYRVALDGGVTRLTDTPAIETMPTWNAGGTLVASATATSFGTGAGWSDIGLSVAHGDGSGDAYAQSPIKSAAAILELSQLAWADNTTLLAALPGFSGPGQIRAVEVDSGDETVIFTGNLAGMAWSPTARALAVAAASYGEGSPSAPGLYLWRPGDAQAHLAAEGSVTQAPVWGPTGQWAAFVVESDDGAGDVWLAPIDPEREPRPLSRGPAHAIIWSPDGKLIAAGGNLWHLNGSPVDPLPGADASPLAWTDEGLFFLSRDEPAGEHALRLWTELGATELDRDIVPFDARLAPLLLPELPRLDPAGLLPEIYSSTESTADGFSIQALDPASGAQREVGVIPYEPGGISRVWTVLPSPDGRKVAVSATGVELLSQLYLIENGQTRLLSPAAADNSPQDWSPDGRTLLALSTRNAPEACAQYTCFYDIYAIDVATGAETQLTATADAEQDAVWSPQGDLIAFTRGCNDPGNVSCAPSLYVMGADGTGERLLAEGGVDEIVFSPDGAQIAYRQKTDGFSSIYVVATLGGEPRQVTGEPQMTDLRLRWSPDGRALAFTRIEGVCQVEDCTEATYIVDPAGGAPRLVRVIGEWGKLLSSLWTEDGRLLLAVRERGDTARLLAYAPDGTPLGEAHVTIPRRDSEP